MGELEILVWTGGEEMEVPPMYLALRVGKNDTTQEGMAPKKPSDCERKQSKISYIIKDKMKKRDYLKCTKHNKGYKWVSYTDNAILKD